MYIVSKLIYAERLKVSPITYFLEIDVIGVSNGEVGRDLTRSITVFDEAEITPACFSQDKASPMKAVVLLDTIGLSVL